VFKKGLIFRPFWVSRYYILSVFITAFFEYIHINVRVLKRRIKKHSFELYVEMLDGRPDSFIDREFPLMRSPDDPRMLKVFKQTVLAGKCDGAATV